VESTDEVFFASDSDPFGNNSALEHNNFVSKINLQAVEQALKAQGPNGSVNVYATPLDIPDTVQQAGGGTGPFRGSLLLVTGGRGNLPPSVVLVDPQPPYNTTVLLDNYFGRQFNSLDDVKVHPGSGQIFFTDPTYGYLEGFRSTPLLPNQVYRLNPDTRAVRVAADGFVECNGIAFSGDGKTAYVTDTGLESDSGIDQTKPATIYAFDIHPQSQAFSNRRVFAYVDTGAPDGISVDSKGNVWAGCGDGVQVWNPEGTLIGKFFLGTTSSNFIFAGKGRVVILALTKIYLAQIDVTVEGIDLSGRIS
jgi:gluconolactonase